MRESAISKQHKIADRVVRVLREYKELTPVQLQIKASIAIRDYYLLKAFIEEIKKDVIEYDHIDKVWRILKIDSPVAKEVDEELV